MQGMYAVGKTQGAANRRAYMDDNGVVRMSGRGKRIFRADIELGCAALVILGQEKQETELAPAIVISVVEKFAIDNA